VLTILNNSETESDSNSELDSSIDVMKVMTVQNPKWIQAVTTIVTLQ